MKLRVHLLESFDDDWIEQFKNELDDTIELTMGKTLPSPATYHVLVAGVPQREHITASDRLRSLVIPWSGLPKATRILMTEFPEVAIYNLHHNATAAAEHALALMLAAAKRIVPFDRGIRQNDWTPRYLEGTAAIFEGKRAVILGYGAIGRRLASYCHGLGMHVHGVKRHTSESEDQYARIHDAGRLVAVLKDADVLLVCVPLTPDTKGLIGEKELSMLAEDAIVVNVARGRVIDEAALYQALKEGRIRAGLDVWYLYPQDEPSRRSQPPSSYPFHELDNVVMTPHIAGHSVDIETHRRRELAQLLNDLANGETPLHRIDPERGY